MSGAKATEISELDQIALKLMEAPHPQGPPDRYKGTKSMHAMAAEDMQRKKEGRQTATQDKYGNEIDPVGRKKNDSAFFFCC